MKHGEKLAVATRELVVVLMVREKRIDMPSVRVRRPGVKVEKRCAEALPKAGCREMKVEEWFGGRVGGGGLFRQVRKVRSLQCGPKHASVQCATISVCGARVKAKCQNDLRHPRRRGQRIGRGGRQEEVGYCCH